MPRGGKRPGAGRKPGRAHSDIERLAIGARCEHLWRQAEAEALNDKIARLSAVVGEVWAEAKQVPAESRRKWLRSYAGQDHPDNVEFALREQQGIAEEDETPTRRFSVVTPPRPYERRRPIIAQVANETGVSGRSVERYWKEFRQIDSASDD